MTKEEAIKFLQQLYPNGGHCWLDEQRIEAIGMAIKALQEEPVSEEQVKELTKTQHVKETCKENGNSLTQEPASEDLEKASFDNAQKNYKEGFRGTAMQAFNEGADWCMAQMMAKAIDVTIAIPYQNGYGGYTQLVDSKEGLPFGDNLKVLIIKQE